MEGLLNWKLLASPYNWVTVFLMTAFALLLLNVTMPEQPNKGT